MSLSRFFKPNAILPALCGGIYALALARYLFENWPQTLTFFGDWPGGLLFALLGGGALYVWAMRAQQTAPAIALLLPGISVVSPEVNLLRAQILLIGALALFMVLAWPGKASTVSIGQRRLPMDQLTNYLPPLLLFGLLCLIYLHTIAPTVGEADTFEYQVAAARLGIAHGSGYPLLILLGRLFAELPLGGTFAFRVNLAGAFSCCLAAISVERLARRLGAAPLAAFLAGLAYGVSPMLWLRATGIETHPLNAVFLAALLYLCIEMIAGDPLRRSPRWLYGLAFVFGLGLTSHLTIVLLAPACAVAAAWWLVVNGRQLTNNSRPARLTFYVSRHFLSFAIRHSFIAIFFLFLGLAVFLYIPLRWPAVNHGEWLSLEHFIYILKGGEAPGAFDPFLPFHDFSRFAPWLQKIVGEYSPAGFAVAVVGALALVGRYPLQIGRGKRWAITLVVALMFAGHGYFALTYNTREPDWSDFFITVNVVTAVLMGLGLQAILDLGLQISNYWPKTLSLKPYALSLALSAFTIIPLSSIWLTLPRIDHSADWEKYRLGQYTLRQPLAQNAAILVDPAHMAPLYYQQIVENIRSDLDVIILPGEADYRAVLDERLAAGQVVYLGRYLSGLGSGYSLRSVGPLAEVSPAPFTTAVEISHPLSATLGNTIQLLGFETETLQTPNALALTLYWRTPIPADDNYLVNLRLVSPAGEIAWQNAARVPVNGLYPTNAWRPGETVSDFHLIPFNPELAPGDYLLEVNLLPPFKVSNTEWVKVTAITVAAPSTAPQPSHALRARFGTQWLMGWDAPETVTPGAAFNITLYWLHAGGQDIVTAFGEKRSLANWPINAIVPQVYRLTAPTQDEQFTRAVATGDSAQCKWLALSTSDCALPAIRLAGAAITEGAYNFDQQLLLRSAKIETPAAKPGDAVNVTLEWQGLKAIPADYTVFVHLVGPDGKLYGQVDYWPMGGTLGTSSWPPGQIIADPYRVALAADAPPGEYTVHVGMYLLATMERLPVLNADGAPVDDKVVVMGLTVQ